MILEKNELSALFSDSGVEISDEQYERFSTYSGLLVEWNERINLTAITDPYGISEKHLLDSVLPLKLISIPKGARLIDVGTGAGFPALPMKIMRPDLEITLLDSLNKRVNFLKAVCAELSIEAEFFHARAEDAGRSELLRESFDIAAARAVASLPELCEYCLPFVKTGGRFIALKGKSGRDEAAAAGNAAEALGAASPEVIGYSLPNGDERSLVVVRKLSDTPKAYPRSSKAILGRPL